MGDTMSDIIVNIHAKYDPVVLLDPFGDFDTKIFQKQFSEVEGLVSTSFSVEEAGSRAAVRLRMPLHTCLT